MSVLPCQELHVCSRCKEAKNKMLEFSAARLSMCKTCFNSYNQKYRKKYYGYSTGSKGWKDTMGAWSNRVFGKKAV